MNVRTGVQWHIESETNLVPTLTLTLTHPSAYKVHNAIMTRSTEKAAANYPLLQLLQVCVYVG